MREIWFDISGTNGMYQISTLSKARSFNKMGPPAGVKLSTPRSLTVGINPRGYYYVFILVNGKRKTISIHRSIAKKFIPNPKNLPFINHKDGNKLNNSINNLEWCLHKHNIQHAIGQGLNIPAKGEHRKKSNLTNADVINILTSTKSCSELGRLFHIGYRAIYDIKKGRSWNHVTGLLCTRPRKSKWSNDIKYASQ